MRRILTGFVFILMLTGGAGADPFRDGMAAYERGDYSTALLLWQPLAEQGNAVAQYKLGFMYAKGLGAPQDYAEAVKWFRLAAEAVKWYRLAAEQGNAKAQYFLGKLYAKGEGVPQDYVQAHMWFNLAASRYLASEAEDRDVAVRKRDFIASKMTAAQIAEAQKLAREWKPK